MIIIGKYEIVNDENKICQMDEVDINRLIVESVSDVERRIRI